MRRAGTIPALCALATFVALSVPKETSAQLATSLPSPSEAGNLLGGGLSSFADESVEQAAPDSVLRVTLAQALRLAANVDPNYVAALRQVGDADWVRRQAWMAFIIPSADFRWSWNRFSSPQFNLGTGDLADELTTATLGARYDLFTGGARIYDMQGSAARVDGARAGELQARFETALGTEADYYEVIAQTELPNSNSRSPGLVCFPARPFRRTRCSFSWSSRVRKWKSCSRMRQSRCLDSNWDAGSAIPVRRTRFRWIRFQPGSFRSPRPTRTGRP
jgi:hypothetical protein